MYTRILRLDGCLCHNFGCRLNDNTSRSILLIQLSTTNTLNNGNLWFEEKLRLQQQEDYVSLEKVDRQPTQAPPR